MLCQQPDETLFGHFVIALKAAFHQQLSLADEGYGSVQIPLTYPFHYKRLLTFTMFPAGSTLHSTQFPPHLAVHHKLHPDQCADACLLAQQTTTLQTAPQYAQTTQMMNKKISRWYPWMMNTGLLKKHLKELSVSTNMDYRMDYASSHVLMRTITLFHPWTVWI